MPGRQGLEPVYNYLERQRSKSKLAKQNLASQFDSAQLIKSGTVLRKFIATSDSRDKLSKMQKSVSRKSLMDQIKESSGASGQMFLKDFLEKGVGSSGG